METKKRRWMPLIQALLLMMLILVVGGCAKAPAAPAPAEKNDFEAVNAQIEVLSLKIGMTDSDLIKALGETEKDNCVYGYEMNYDDKQVSVGVNTGGKIRRIKTSNPDTTICGVKPGTNLDEAIKSVVKAGYPQVAGTKKFESQGIRVELLSKENKLADQISIEIIEK